MIVVYTSPGCASCRKVKQWLKDRNLEFIEKNIFKTVLNEKEIKTLFETGVWHIKIYYNYNNSISKLFFY